MDHLKEKASGLFQKVTSRVEGLKLGSETSSSGASEGIAVCWGQGQNKVEPPAQLVVDKCKEAGVTRVRLYSTLSAQAEKALANSGIKVMITCWPDGNISNRSPVDGTGPPFKGQAPAEKWIESHVIGPRTRGVEVDFVLVGNEPNFDKSDYDRSIVPSLGNICDALTAKGLKGKVRASIPMGGGGLYFDSWPPSKCHVSPKNHQLFRNICHYLHGYGSPYMAHVHPFWGCNPDKRQGCESYYVFRPHCNLAFTDPANQIRYSNCFDSDIDSVYHALQKVGFSDIPIIIGETGWPTAGGPKATPQLAKEFNQAMLNRMSKGQGTPLHPSRVPEVIFFEMIDSDKKSGPEAHWGLFTYDAQNHTLNQKYTLALPGGGTASA